MPGQSKQCFCSWLFVFRGWVVVLAVGAGLLPESHAQERAGRGRWRDRGPSEGVPDDPAARLRFRIERAERMISMFDANQDGVIEPNEVRGQPRYIYERMAKEAGLNPTHSIAVAEFRAAVIRHIQQSEQQAKSPPGGPGSSASPPAGPSPPGPSSSGSTGPGAGGPSGGTLRGFDAPGTNLPKPAGFGPAGGSFGPAGSSSGSAGSIAPGGSSAPPPGSPERQQLEERVRQYAQSLFRQYDANKNGVLEREEWQQMRGSPEKADRNNDGRITLEELTARELERNQLAFSGSSSSSSFGSSSSGSSSTASAGSSGSSSNWTSRSSSSSGSSGSFSRPSGSGSGWSGHSRSSSSSGKSGQPGRVRFLTPLERLPKGLPDWFVQKDADGDGQISMAEFAAEWTDAKAAEFQKYDLNNDGIMTPEECLRAEKMK